MTSSTKVGGRKAADPTTAKEAAPASGRGRHRKKRGLVAAGLILAAAAFTGGLRRRKAGKA